MIYGGGMGARLGFDGKVAIVTGSAGGLGRAHALLLASRGALVVINDVGGAVDGTGADRGAAETTAEEIRSLGGEAVADSNSVATSEGGRGVVETAIDAFGRVDIVVNNAGILRDKSFHKMTPDLWSAVIDVHLNGAYHVTAAAWPSMRDQGYGRIVSTASGAGLFGNFGQANYGAAKMGLVGFTRVLALEGAKCGIKANVISPIASTRMTAGLLGSLSDRLEPQLVSPVVAVLAHESCDATGRIFSVGGGRVAEVFIGEGPGYTPSELTPEGVADNWEAVTDRSTFDVPAHVGDEIRLYRRHFS